MSPEPHDASSMASRKDRLKYPAGVPDKFSPSGTPQPFPGNTIICPLRSDSNLHASLLGIYHRLQESPLADLYALLPASSWHMTVFDCVCDSRRGVGRWPSDLADDASLEECTELFQRKLDGFHLGSEMPLQLSITGVDSFEQRSGIALHVEPAPDDEEALRRLRDRLAERLQIRKSDHESYGFHLSMAYLLQHLSEEQEAELMRTCSEHLRHLLPILFELGEMAFCTFPDMRAYEPVLVLKGRQR